MLEILEKTFKTGTVTIKYPEKPDPVPSRFRGKPEIFPVKCTYCGDCSKACLPGVISLVEDKEKNEERLILSYCGCIFCGRCEEVCQYRAIQLTQEYEMASKTKNDLILIVRRKL